MSQQSQDVRIRRMGKPDLQQVLDLINKEGWEYDISEVERILRIDPVDSIVACSGDVVVGGITIATVGGRCIMGHVVVKEGWRRKGLGKTMMSSVLKDMESRGVDFLEVYSLMDAANFYEKFGFETIEGLKTYLKRALTEEDCAPLHSKRIRELALSDLPQVGALDSKVLGFDRSSILECLMKDFPRQCKGLFDGNELVGFIMGRTTPVIDDVGPWIMERPSVEDGRLLLRALFSAKKPGARVIFGLPEGNRVAREALSSMGFRNERDQLRLVRSGRRAEQFSPGTMAMSAFEFG